VSKRGWSNEGSRRWSVCGGRGRECRCESRFVDLVGGLKVQWAGCYTESDRGVKERGERMTAVGNCGGENGVRPWTCGRRCRGLVVRERENWDKAGGRAWNALPLPPNRTPNCNCTQTFAQGLRPIRSVVCAAPNLVGPGNDVSQTQRLPCYKHVQIEIVLVILLSCFVLYTLSVVAAVCLILKLVPACLAQPALSSSLLPASVMHHWSCYDPLVKGPCPQLVAELHLLLSSPSSFVCSAPVPWRSALRLQTRSSFDLTETDTATLDVESPHSR